MFKNLKKFKLYLEKNICKKYNNAEQIKEQGQKLWNNILEGPLGNDSSKSKIVIVRDFSLLIT